MSNDIEILRQKNPVEAEWIEAWRRKYQRDYDLTKTEDQANLYEGMVELGRHLAANYGWANLNIDLTTAGVGFGTVTVAPRT